MNISMLLKTRTFRACYIILWSLMVAVPLKLHAQYEQIWAFGQFAGLDFNSGAPLSFPSSILGFGESSASVCDADGNLLFYTEGTDIWDRNHNLMPNGQNLILESFSCGSPYSNTSSTSQGALIVPVPDQPSRYYIFSLTAQECGQNQGRLYYSIVDMELNAGMGDVVAGQKGIFIANMLTEKMSAVAGNDCNIWLLCQRQDEALLAYEITTTGVNTTPVFSPFTSMASGVIGKIAVAPDRHRLAITYFDAFPGVGTAEGGVCLYDFDPGTGMATNRLVLRHDGSDYYGICFSPDNTKLYVNEFGGLFSINQFDLSAGVAADVINSYTFIDSATFSDIKLGPDQQLYYFTNQSLLIGAIEQPNLVGAACSPVDAIQLSNCLYHGGLPSVVPIIRGGSDTVFHTQEITVPCFQSSYDLLLNDDATSVIWEDGPIVTARTVTTSDTYVVSYVYADQRCVLYVDTFIVSFNPARLPILEHSPSCIGLDNGSAWLTGSPSDTVQYFYTWVNGAGDTLSVTDTLNHVPSGDYTLLIHTAHCDTGLNFIIPEVDYRVSFSASDTLICMGESVQFQNTSDAHFTQFQWYFGDGDSALLQQPPDHQYLHAGIYEVLLSGTGAICKDSAYTTITVDSLFTLDFEPDQPAICTGDHINFQLSESDSTLTQLHWSFGDGSELHSSYEHVIQHAYDTAGNFPVTLTTQFRACPDNVYTDTVQVYALPLVDLGQDTSLCLDGHAVVLYNLAAAPNETHYYLWNTGDTTAGLRVLQPGSYSLTLSTEPLGCTTTDEIVIDKDCYTDIPNAFTPNGDGDNDYFFPRTQLSKSVSSFKMQVFNRWGQLIFETTSTDGLGWDGRFNDEDQPMGVYIYRIDVGYVNSREEYYEGNVTLLR